jgi:hypothetical protein
MTLNVSLAPVARQQFLDANGNPLVGAMLFTYKGGTNTKQATYTDSTGNTANTNPIILDSSGRPPSGVWLTNNTYKFVFTSSTDTDPPTSPIYTEDGILTEAVLSSDSTSAQWQSSGLTPTYLSATSFSVVGDKTAIFEVGRRLKCTIAASYVYSTVLTVSYSSGVTTVTVRNDSSALTSNLNAVSYSLLTYTNHAIPNVYAPIITGKNLLINPAFSINQRSVAGTVILAAGAYGHDRWKAGAAGCTYTYATVNGLTTLTITAGSLQQVVEILNVPFGTNTLCLSWTGTAQGKIAGGSYSASGVTASVLGGATCTVEFNTGTLTLVQLEKSTFPTTFEQRAYQAELDLCHRYYERITTETATSYVLGAGWAVTTAISYTPYVFSKEKRIAPTVTSSGFAGFSTLYAALSVAATALNTFYVTKKSVVIALTHAGTPFAVGNAISLSTGTTIGTWLAFDAEL